MSTTHLFTGSTAVMARRAPVSSCSTEGLDDFPTPPWATRALCEYGLPKIGVTLAHAHVHEPACNRGQMAEALREYARDVTAADVHDYGYGEVSDFLDTTFEPYDGGPDWIITNPPFNAADRFVTRGLSVAKRGVAVLCRTAWLEGKGRYGTLFGPNPPDMVAVFVERVPMRRGMLSAKIATATSYAWFVWHKTSYPRTTPPIIAWIPPCRTSLTREGDYVFPTER